MTATINDIPVEAATWPSLEVAAIRELLRQRAVARGFISAGAADGGALDRGIEQLLADEVKIPSPGEPECRRYYEANPNEFRSGDLIFARHILFQVTSSIPLPAIRARAEQTLGELLKEPDRFDSIARELSNCPSGQHGGNLGQIARGDMVPEFEEAVFRPGPTGILRQLIKSRFGFHIVAVDKRIRGETLPFETVQERIAEGLRAAVEARALRQYVSFLAGQAEITGVDLNAAPTPLVQ